MDRNAFVCAVLDLYLGLPDTAARRPSANDRALAGQLFDRGFAFEIVSAALLLASLRRSLKADAAPSLQPVRSLHYFLPVIVELTAAAPDSNYLQHIHSRFSRLRDRLRGQISTGSRGR
jgi:hypothetical protein